MKRLMLLAPLIFAVAPVLSKNVELSSPGGKYTATIKVENRVSIDFKNNGNTILTAKDIFIDSDKGQIPVENARIKKVIINSIDRIVTPVIKEKNAQIVDKYNEIVVKFSDKSSLAVRLYDNGAAYRIISEIDGEIIISKESAKYIIDTSSKLIWQSEKILDIRSGESAYYETSISQAAQQSNANLPVFVKLPSGEDILFLESDVHDYPVMWLKKDGENLRAAFWKYPKALHNTGDKYSDQDVKDEEEFMAKTSGSRSFPWRAFAFSDDDSGLLSNQLVYLLASECCIDDPSWIQTGWVTFDWWARNGIYGTDFKAGNNTATAKYLIDFAAHYGLKYFLFDDGWSGWNRQNQDLTKPVPDINMKEVSDYAKSKGVNLMLWVTHDNLEVQMDKAFKQFSEWGVKGIKVDFMDRNDQLISHFYEKAAAEAAKYKMVIDFHGGCVPNGIRRMYPNILTREGLVDFEYNTCVSYEDPHHECLLPFIRGVAGPADFIPCTTYNSTKSAFRNTNPPTGQGTRVHSMALSLVIESPMQMLPDPPSDYYRENECTEFFTSFPLVWDETKPLDSKIGEYVSLARRNGDNWYVAAITDWSARQIKIDLSFLPKGNYKMEFYKDGINADIRAIDYVKGFDNVKSGDILNISMAPGGGWVARITPLK